jgi:hypothetical protein
MEWHNDLVKMIRGGSPMDKVLAERNARVGARSTITLSYSQSPNSAMSASSAESVVSALPKGISAGKIAGIVAATAVVAGGIHLLTRTPEAKPSWTDRIHAERNAQAGQTQPLR